MTENERQQVIDALIENCACWDDEDREFLESLEDNQLAALADCAEESIRHQEVANAARRGFTDPVGNKHVYNEETGKWESEITGNSGDPKPSLEDWLADAPTEVQSAVRNAMAMEAEQRKQLIANITAGLGKQDKEKLIKDLKLESRPLSELNYLLMLANKQPAGKPTYQGSASPPGPEPEKGYNEDDVLPLPELTWSEK